MDIAKIIFHSGIIAIILLVIKTHLIRPVKVKDEEKDAKSLKSKSFNLHTKKM